MIFVVNGITNISTHVSARRRTLFCHYLPQFAIFQLTSPQGDEPNYHDLMIIQDHFNSRLRKETNLNHILRSISVFQISIHVFVVRRTQQSYHFPAYAKISIHVSLRRRTFLQHFTYSYFHISTHVSARRRTSILERKARNSTISIHVSARRRT